MRRYAAVWAAAVMTVTVGAPAAVAVPDDGNGSKEVIEVDDAFQVPCASGVTLDVTLSGWFQISSSGNSARNLQRSVFHIALTFTAPSGDSWTWMDVGPDRVFLIDGVPHLAVTGRPSFSPLDGAAHNGTVWIDLTTGEVVHAAGNTVGDVIGIACSKLAP